jgi:Reverse transcriptase (RNA-dependent DNA polymerase)
LRRGNNSSKRVGKGVTVVIRWDEAEIRFADDAILCFHYREDTENLKSVLSKRFAKYGLTLHPEKTRLLEFGRYSEERAKRQGKKKPGTFDFLALTHICARSRRGKFTVHVRTMGASGSAGASRRSPNGARSTDMHRWISSRKPSTPSSETTTSTTDARQTLRAF